MNKSSTALYLDLKKRTAEVKVHGDTFEYIGGLGLALKLLVDLKELNPIIFSIGPLNSSIPFVSKCCCVFTDSSGRLVETYGGGSLGLVLSLTSFEAIVILGRSQEPLTVNVTSNKIEFIESQKADPNILGLPGRCSRVRFTQGAALIDRYFNFDSRLGIRAFEGNLSDLVVSSDRSIEIKKVSDYTSIYYEILSRGRQLSVPYHNSLSCSGCPAGCERSFESEKELDLDLTLPYCLVACGFAAKIFNDIPTVFSCLSALDLQYNHELIEDIPVKISQMRAIYEKN